MFDVVDRAREALENDETITSEILQQFATDTKEIEATKGRAAYFKRFNRLYRPWCPKYGLRIKCTDWR